MNKFEEAIAFFEEDIIHGEDCDDCNRLRLAITALREKAERMNPQPLTLEALKERENPKPLTLKQLRERVGKPYYHKSLAGNGNKWLILQPDVAENPLAYNYRETWLAYDHEPKEAII